MPPSHPSSVTVRSAPLPRPGIWRWPVRDQPATSGTWGKGEARSRGAALTGSMRWDAHISYCGLAEKKPKTLPRTKIILQSFNSLTRVKSLCFPMQLALHPHLQRLGKETHSQGSSTIPPSLPTTRVQQPAQFPLHGCHPTRHQSRAHGPAGPERSARPDPCSSFALPLEGERRLLCLPGWSSD